MIGFSERNTQLFVVALCLTNKRISFSQNFFNRFQRSSQIRLVLSIQAVKMVKVRHFYTSELENSCTSQNTTGDFVRLWSGRQSTCHDTTFIEPIKARGITAQPMKMLGVTVTVRHQNCAKLLMPIANSIVFIVRCNFTAISKKIG